MLKGIQIIGIGAAVTAISLIITHTVGFSHDFTSFLMGMGCGLSLVGAGKRFVEMRKK
ncbi:MAG: hypothetical protein FWH48_12095 [Oscillospiraceae bacterium]|nr:hypothetical protein [Oscillospiraceae bacterium]